MRMRVGFVLGAAVGYVLGARAGHERYEQMKRAAGRVAGSPVAQSAAATVQTQAEKVENVVAEKLSMGQDSAEGFTATSGHSTGNGQSNP